MATPGEHVDVARNVPGFFIAPPKKQMAL